MPRDGSATRERILDVAEKLVIDQGFSATSVDEVIAGSGTSKGAFFHHFSSKADLARRLVERYAAADVDELRAGLEAVAGIDDAGRQVVEFVRFFEEGADRLMSAQSSCLYVAVLTERQLAGDAATAPIRTAVHAWRAPLADLLREATAGRGDLDCEALADHLFVTFEGAFVLARATGDPGVMRAQLATLRRLLEALLVVSPVRSPSAS